MASINYFFKSVSENFAFDDYVYGLNDIKKVAAVGSVKFNDSSYSKVLFSNAGISYTDTLGRFAKVHFAAASADSTVTIVDSEEVQVGWYSSNLNNTNVVNYLADAINNHHTSSNNQGPGIVAVANVGVIKSILLTQTIPGYAGNTIITSGGINLHSTLFSGSSVTFTNFSGGTDRTGTGMWAPTTGTTTSLGIKLYDNYVFSPKHYGYFSDTFYSPPGKYHFSNKFTSITTTEPIVQSFLATSSYRLTSNTDNYLRMITRYVDGETSYSADETYYETL